MPTYKEVGVDIEAGQSTVELIKPLAGATHGPQVLGGVGAFAGLFALDSARYRHPVLVASTDGVGTKVLLAETHHRYFQIGVDLVNHCVNDVLTTGADPLFFLDYVATGRLDPGVVAEVVAGIADACRKVDCALLGGETAEMPDLYAGTTFDLAGFLVGIAERDELIDPSLIRDGDAILALPSSGLHTNGYSLARRVVPTQALPQAVTPGGPSVLDALLEPHRCYLEEVRRLREAVRVKGLAHITGGGVVGNLPRILPDGLGAEIVRRRWPEPPIFGYLAPFVPDEELWRTFNMGLGMLVVVDPAEAPAALRALDGGLFQVGTVTAGGRVLVLE
jgi:phosphoribosylformylglycinamidine cyclo-ligase